MRNFINKKKIPFFLWYFFNEFLKTAFTKKIYIVLPIWCYYSCQIIYGVNKKLEQIRIYAESLQVCRIIMVSTARGVVRRGVRQHNSHRDCPKIVRTVLDIATMSDHRVFCRHPVNIWSFTFACPKSKTFLGKCYDFTVFLIGIRTF